MDHLTYVGADVWAIIHPHGIPHHGIRVLQVKGVDLMHLTSLNECNSMGFIDGDGGGLSTTHSWTVKPMSIPEP